MNLDLNQTITLSPEVISQEVSGETVLLDLQSENYFGLDEVGTRIWQLINENDGACVIAVLNAVLQCHAILLLLFHVLVVATSLAIIVVLELMYWAQQSMWLNACCGGLVCEDCGCAP